MNLDNFFGHIYTFFCIKLRKMKIDKSSLLIRPLKIDNPQSISIGSRVYVGKFSWLMGGEDKAKITLNIEDDVQIGHFAHIVAKHNVCIKKNVLIADKVFISDCNHEYRNINKPIMYQGVIAVNDVNIGEETWIGENVSICGASIGKHCVIGANSVVIDDVPDYSIAVGNPAKVVKKYDFKSKQWKKTKDLQES